MRVAFIGSFRRSKFLEQKEALNPAKVVYCPVVRVTNELLVRSFHFLNRKHLLNVALLS